jgi:hypothetical protein
VIELRKFLGSLGPDVLNDFRQWRLPFPMGADDQIHQVGVEEWHMLADVYKARFPSFLNRPYDQEMKVRIGGIVAKSPPLPTLHSWTALIAEPLSSRHNE